MTRDDAPAYLDAAASLIGLQIEPEWRPNVLRFFEVARAFAEAIEATGALEHDEAAAIFTPQDSE